MARYIDKSVLSTVGKIAKNNPTAVLFTAMKIISTSYNCTIYSWIAVLSTVTIVFHDMNVFKSTSLNPGC